jgi:hypothetical protein
LLAVLQKAMNGGIDTQSEAAIDNSPTVPLMKVRATRHMGSFYVHIDDVRKLILALDGKAKLLPHTEIQPKASSETIALSLPDCPDFSE